MKERELKNGRLAMVAFLGFCGQYLATGKVCWCQPVPACAWMLLIVSGNVPARAWEQLAYR